MKHLSEDDLIELYYSKEEPVRASRHLAGCAQCARAYAELESDLAAVESIEPPLRDAAYGDRLWQSLAPFLPVYEERKRALPRIGRWIYAAACVLMIAGAFLAGRVWEHTRPQTLTASNPAAIPPPTLMPQLQPQHQPEPRQRERVVVVLLGDHLDRSERLLVELKHADVDSAEMVSPLRDEARSLLTANRICRQEVKQQDDPALAEALDRLENLLVELANPQGGLNAAALTRLQNEMNSNSLLFEVRILRSRIPDQQPTENLRSKGGTI
jgi:hypothetical protein